MGKNKKTVYLWLHLLLLIYSLSSVLSKLASQASGLSLLLLYGGVIALLGIYALGWQQVIKYLPLTTAYANKAITVVWGLVWGVLLFHERITLPKLAGAALVVAGVVLFAQQTEEESHG